MVARPRDGLTPSAPASGLCVGSRRCRGRQWGVAAAAMAGGGRRDTTRHATRVDAGVWAHRGGWGGGSEDAAAEAAEGLWEQCRAK